LVYPDRGDTGVGASSTKPSPVAFLHSTLDPEADVDRFAAGGRRGISLRMRAFCGPESSQTQELIAYARRGFAVVLGGADAYQSSIWVEDAAHAVVAAMECARSEIVTLMAGAVGRKRLVRVPGRCHSEPQRGISDPERPKPETPGYPRVGLGSG